MPGYRANGWEIETIRGNLETGCTRVEWRRIESPYTGAEPPPRVSALIQEFKVTVQNAELPVIVPEVRSAICYAVSYRLHPNVRQVTVEAL